MINGKPRENKGEKEGLLVDTMNLPLERKESANSMQRTIQKSQLITEKGYQIYLI
jgi:hypothetical protein